MWTLLSSSSDFVGESLIRFGESTGLAGFFSAMGWGNIVMIGIAFFLLYLAIRHKFEPLLLLTIAFGMLLTNLPLAGIMDEPIYEILSNPTYHGKNGIPIYNGDLLVGYQYIKQNGGLLYYLYQALSWASSRRSSSWASAR